MFKNNEHSGFQVLLSQLATSSETTHVLFCSNKTDKKTAKSLLEFITNYCGEMIKCCPSHTRREKPYKPGDAHSMIETLVPESELLVLQMSVQEKTEIPLPRVVVTHEQWISIYEDLEDFDYGHKPKTIIHFFQITDIRTFPQKLEVDWIPYEQKITFTFWYASKRHLRSLSLLWQGAKTVKKPHYPLIMSEYIP
jgi:hypothetical protein